MSLFRKFFTAAGATVAIAAALAMGASAAMAGPFAATWNQGALQLEREIFPIMKAHSSGGFYTAPQYYSYSTPYSASVNTPDNIEQSNVAHFFLHDDGNELSLFTFFDRPRDADGGLVFADITSSGLAGNNDVYVSVRDDPGDSSYTWNTATGTSSPTWRWSPCCTDGMVLSGLPNGVGDEWSLNFQFNDIDGINQFKVFLLNDFYENGGRTIQEFSIPASQANTLVISRTSEVTASVPAPAGLIFPLAAIALIALRRRMT